MLRILAIGGLLLAGASSAAYADVYRWVDEHGTVHYTDQWVPGSELIKSAKARSDSPHSATEPSKMALEANQALTQAQQQKDVDAVKQDLAKVRDQRCKDAKDKYQKAIEARRIFKPSKDGKDDETNRDYMTEDEADAYRVQIRSEVEQACGSAPQINP
jgi:hypothetical protein